jgi:hypothetical protein
VKRLLVALAPALIFGACVVDSEVTRIGPMRPARAENCKVQVFPATAPSYPHVDIASVRATCPNVLGRSACIDELQKQACLAGGDTVYGFAEGVHGPNTLLSATLAARDESPSTPAAALLTKRAAPVQAVDEQACAPICSPGFVCQSGSCIPLCNPACLATEICNRHRTCEPAPPHSQTPATAGTSP